MVLPLEIYRQDEVWIVYHSLLFLKLWEWHCVKNLPTFETVFSPFLPLFSSSLLIICNCHGLKCLLGNPKKKRKTISKSTALSLRSRNVLFHHFLLSLESGVRFHLSEKSWTIASQVSLVCQCIRIFTWQFRPRFLMFGTSWNLWNFEVEIMFVSGSTW